MAKSNETETNEELGYDPDAAPDNEATQGLDTEDSAGFSFNMKEETASSGFPLIPPGTYDSRIDEVQFKISQSSGNPMWQVRWAFEGGELGEKNRKITSFVVFSPEQRGRAKMFLKRIAPELAELEDFNPKAIADQQTLVGKKGRLKINHRPDQEGAPQSNVQDVLAPAAGGAGGSFNL